MPRAEKTPVFLLLLGFACASGVFYLWQPSHLNVYDEGLILTGAFRILAGDFPSADFYTNYGPAQFYLVAAALELLGNTADSGRILHALVLALSLLASLKTLACVGIQRTRLPVLSLVFVLLIYHGTPTPLYPAITCIPLLLAGCILTIRVFETERWSRYLLSISILVATVSLLRYDLGLMAMVAFAVPLLLVRPHGPSDASTRPSQRRRLFQYLAATASTLLLCWGLLFAAGILEPALRDILTYNGTNYAAMRALPFPGITELFAGPIDTLGVYLPLLSVAIATLVCLTETRATRTANPKPFLSIITLAAITLGFCLKGLVRTHPIHMLMAGVPAVILLALSLQRGVQRRQQSIPVPSGTFPIRAATVAGAIALGTCWHAFATQGILLGHAHPSPRPKIPALGSLAIHPDEAEVVAHLLAATQPGDRILAASGRHDKVFVNNISIYFLAQRLPATRWHHFDPGVQTTEHVQREMIRELKQHDVEYLMLDTRWDEVEEPNDSAKSSGVHLLDDYIAETYPVVQEFGPLSLRSR